MVGAGVHTADGIPLGDLKEYEEIFEAYPMQKVLGRRLFQYCFPATFLIPFIMEPIFAIYLPYHIMKLLLGRYAGVRKREAEKTMEFFTPMDMARYGDLALNVLLVVLIFFFPAGQMLKLFLGLIVSHIFVYYYDKYRVLRASPAFCFAGNATDEWAQAIMVLPCGFTLVAIVFKANCVIMPDYMCLQNYRLGLAMFAAFMIHCIVHLMLLRVVRAAGQLTESKTKASKPYAEIAAITPCSWFSANPVHCLRSKHIYGHSPACNFFVRGHEHKLSANAKTGCYFQMKAEDTIKEDFDDYLDAK
jgi:hypothetical protein